MISRSEIIDSILKSIEILLNEKLKRLKFDKTIVCDLVVENGTFRFSYLKDSFSAVFINHHLEDDIMAQEDNEKKYRYRVRVLIPENDWSN